ncbi:MAG: hypothetical protein IJ242_06385 [Clostridia bacterium]|nr:hypothetical protein [Clostridia bacterium]
MILNISDDFDLSRIAGSGQCFRWQRQSDESYRIIHGQECLYIRQTGAEQYELDCSEDAFSRIWHAYFDLDTRYAQIRARIDSMTDPYLAEASEAEKGIRILRQDPWEMVISFIISQNRSIPMICQSIEALCRLSGDARQDQRGCLFYTFPVPARIAALSEAELTGPCRLGYRWRYVQSVSRMAASGELNLKEIDSQPDDEARRLLMSLYGVGEKVADCILLFGFHRLNTLPVDVWMKRVFREHYISGYDVTKHSPYNGVYQQYLFAHSRNSSILHGKS